MLEHQLHRFQVLRAGLYAASLIRSLSTVSAHTLVTLFSFQRQPQEAARHMNLHERVLWNVVACSLVDFQDWSLQWLRAVQVTRIRTACPSSYDATSRVKRTFRHVQRRARIQSTPIRLADRRP
jgi:predicted neuraminidase